MLAMDVTILVCVYRTNNVCVGVSSKVVIFAKVIENTQSLYFIVNRCVYNYDCKCVIISVSIYSNADRHIFLFFLYLLIFFFFFIPLKLEYKYLLISLRFRVVHLPSKFFGILKDLLIETFWTTDQKSTIIRWVWQIFLHIFL